MKRLGAARQGQRSYDLVLSMRRAKFMAKMADLALGGADAENNGGGRLPFMSIGVSLCFLPTMMPF